MNNLITIMMFAASIVACSHAVESNKGTSKTSEYQSIQFAGAVATPEERQICEALGGEVRQDGLAGWEHCIQTMPDAGKACQDSSQCIGQCKIVGEYVDFGMPTEGQCSQTDSPFGCFQTVEGGRAEPAICID